MTASEHENEDPFWAMRGAGSGFFGGVLRYKLQLYDRTAEMAVFTDPEKRFISYLGRSY